MATEVPDKAGNSGAQDTSGAEETKPAHETTGVSAMKPSRITTVIFDYGCVLSHVPGPEDFEPLRKAMGAEVAAFQEIYWQNREAYDLDALDVHAYFGEMGAALGAAFTPEQIQRLATLDCNIWAPSNAVMVEWVRVLHDRGLKTAVLSNMSRNVGDYLRREANWLQLFNHLCFSGELKIGKPEPAIYHACLKSLGVTAAESLFIDDREVNIKAAEAVGMHGIVFTTPERLQPELEPYGLAESLKEVIACAS
jgi:putative hydrolase of the HAD superfamily